MGLAHDCHAAWGIGVDGEEKLGNGGIAKRKAQGLGLGAKLALVLRFGGGQSTQKTHARFLHEASRAHAGKQRDLRVIVHDLIARLDNELKGAVSIFYHPLGGQAQGNGLAAQGGFLAQSTHLRQQCNRRVQVTGRQVRVRALIVQAGLGVDERALDVERLHLTGVI